MWPKHGRLTVGKFPRFRNRCTKRIAKPLVQRKGRAYFSADHKTWNTSPCARSLSERCVRPFYLVGMRDQRGVTPGPTGMFARLIQKSRCTECYKRKKEETAIVNRKRYNMMNVNLKQSQQHFVYNFLRKENHTYWSKKASHHHRRLSATSIASPLGQPSCVVRIYVILVPSVKARPMRALVRDDLNHSVQNIILKK